MESNNREGNADQVLEKVQGAAEPIPTPEGFFPSAAEMGPELPAVTVVPPH